MADEKEFLQSRYGLKTNPFTDRAGVAEYFVGRESQKAKWTKVVNSRKGARGSSLNFIVGDYGYGKTLTLYTILEQYKDDPQMLGVYMKLLREDPTSKFGADFIQRFFAVVDVGQIDVNKAKVALVQVPTNLQKQAGVLMKWFDGDENAGAFLSGREQLAKIDLVKLGVRQKISSTDIAKDYLIAFLYALRASGRATVLLCVDEVEYLFSQMRGAKVANVINTLRELYDLPTSPQVKIWGLDIANIVFFFGISESGMTNLENSEQSEMSQGGPFVPFLSRLHQRIELGPLSEKETEQLIKGRLHLNRVTKQPDKDPLIPYNEDFVVYVYELTLGNPREIVERCDYALDDGLEQRVPKLTRAFAEKVFESHGLSTLPDALAQSAVPDTKSQRKR